MDVTGGSVKSRGIATLTPARERYYYEWVLECPPRQLMTGWEMACRWSDAASTASVG